MRREQVAGGRSDGDDPAHHRKSDVSTTMHSAGLPAGLAPWADALSALTPGLALAIGPMVRRIDALVGDREPLVADEGTLDGYGGLARRGRWDQLLPSEWLLAEELPDEFLRRLVEGELLHVAPEYRKSSLRGRIVVLVDAGPAQAGAGRLVQLAALVVLHRRAVARGSQLVVGVLGDDPGKWLTGGLAELLPRWLNGRRDTEPDTGSVARAAEALDADDESWLLTAPALAAELPARRRTLASEVCAWGADGATHVRITLAGATAELPLPASEIAVRALRGAEFRRGGPVVVRPPGVPDLRLPTFNSPSRTLLARGRDARNLLAVRVPDPGSPMGGVRRHYLPGPVVAAARIGRRLITLVVDGHELATHVIGRPLGSGRREPVSRQKVALDDTLLAELLEEPVLPVQLDGEALLCPLAGKWWRILPDGSVRYDREVSKDATHPGRPRFSWARESEESGGERSGNADGEAEYVFGGEATAWSTDGELWRVLGNDGRGTKIVVPPDAQVIGLVRQAESTALITLAMGGRLVRSVRPDGSRTLSRFSGGAMPPVVHPTLPLIAAEPKRGRIVVGDAVSGQVHMTLGSDV